MRLKNFPSRKLIRRLRADGKRPEDHQSEIEAAAEIRTKKHGAGIPGGGRTAIK